MQVYLYFKFGCDIPYDKVQLFKSTVESFVKARPREWMQLVAFRATRVEADLGFIEYVVVLMHREKWQNIGTILNSKAVVSSFALEVTRKLNMKYIQPPVPLQFDHDFGHETTDKERKNSREEQQENSVSRYTESPTNSPDIFELFKSPNNASNSGRRK